LARGNHTLELGIFEGMVLRAYGQTLIGRVHRRSLGHCPGYQNPIDREPEVIVQPTGVVLLNDKDMPPAPVLDTSCRLRRCTEFSLPAVLFE
jgi:hypothetical protein